MADGEIPELHPDVLELIFGYLDPTSIKAVSLVSR